MRMKVVNFASFLLYGRSKSGIDPFQTLYFFIGLGMMTVQFPNLLILNTENSRHNTRHIHNILVKAD